MPRRGIENGKEVLYASYPCIDDGEVDYLVIDEIKDIKTSSRHIKCINYATASTHERDINFSLNYDSENGILLTGSIDSINRSSALDVDEFVDGFADSIYADNDFDLSEMMFQNKNELETLIKKDAFNSDGLIEINRVYRRPIKLYNNNNSIVGIGQSITFSESAVLVEQIISLLPSSEIDIFKIEILNEASTITLTRLSNVELSENKFKEAIAEFKSIEIEKDINSDKLLCAKLSNDYEEALDIMGIFLPKISSMIADSSSDDFDFDFDF